MRKRTPPPIPSTFGATPQGLPYPASTDPVSQGAANIQALAEATDARLVNPAPSASPPSSPIAGQRWALQAAPGVIWTFAYVPTDPTYKWWFIGGPELDAEILTGESTTSASFVDLATVGPTLTVPRTGEYDVTQWAHMNSSVASAVLGAGLYRDTLGEIREDFYSPSAVVGQVASASRRSRARVYSAGDVLTMRYASNGSATATYRFRVLTIRPRRVA